MAACSESSRQASAICCSSLFHLAEIQLSKLYFVLDYWWAKSRAASALRRRRAGGGKSQGGFAYAAIVRKPFVHLANFQAVIHHRLRARHSQSTASLRQFHRASQQRTNRRAVQVRTTSHVQNHASF